MENHPIPQDITGFQFKLIGNMTIKQFVYLAIGGILAWIFFFMIGFPAIIKWPLTALSLGIGACLAFVPIDGRPMDVMLGNFFKALISPTQFLYKKNGGSIADASYSYSQSPAAAQAPASPSPNAVIPSLDQTIPSAQPTPIAAQPVINQTATQPAPTTQAQVLSPTPSSPQMTAPQPAPALVNFQMPAPTPFSIIEEPEETNEKKEREKKIQEEIDRGEKEYLQNQINELKKQLEEAQAKAVAATTLASTPVPPPAPTQTQQDLEKQLTESARQKEALEKQILEMNAKAQTATKQTFKPAVAMPAPATQRVRSVPLGMEKTVGIPSAPEAPNLVTGIIKDPRGNPLANILVEIKDQDSNPVRAFKTNGLGKFASATSLSNGKYLITFEDPGEKNKFDAVQIELQGTTVMPLEIISVDPREELRRELFN